MKNILIIAGPSAVGKTTVAHELLARDSRFEFVRSVTTREKRGDSFDGEYIYLDKEEFERQIASGGVLEYTEYAGALYGTPRSEIDRIADAGRIPLLILDLTGVCALTSKSDGINSCAVYICDDINVMEERLYQRYLGDSSTAEGLKKFVSRKEQNIKDYLKIDKYSLCFYAFVENSGEIYDTVNKINAVYSDFASGVPRDEKRIAQKAKELSDSAKTKLSVNI